MLSPSGSSAPLLGRAAPVRRTVALAVAGSCAVLAMVGLVFALGAQNRPSVMVQQVAQASVLTPQAVAPGAQPMPMYYMPVQPVAQQGLAAAPAATQQPVVYYYVPAVPQVPQPQLAAPVPQMLNESGGGNNTDDEEKKDDFVCTVANLKALSATVQAKWDTCLTNPNYEQPNAKAGTRRLLEWVWEPAPGEARAAPSHKPGHGPSSYEMVLRRKSPQIQLSQHLNQMLNETGGGNETADGGSDDDTPSMADCMDDAVGDACDDISGCDDSVCAHYYNEPEIEALCGMCGMANANKLGCFAKNAQVEVVGKGQQAIGTIEVEDEVLTAEGNSRVFFIHDHKETSKTVRIATEQDSMELTPVHYLPVYTEECGERYCAAAKQVRAETVKVGDRVYAKSAMGFVAKEVTGVSKGESAVRYVITESGTVVVNGVVASVYSTAAGFMETLPFRLMDLLCKGSLQAAPVAAALRTILESPMLQAVESVLNSLAPSKIPLSARAFAPAPVSA